jgi:septal ring factor EnvC (AmiA/AmiB activator)
LEKVEVELGVLTPDQLINSAFWHVSIQDADSAQSFTLPFSDNLNDDFALGARMTVTSDPCEDQLARISFAQRAIENTRGAIKQLHSSPESPKIEKEIEELENELLALQAKLAQAQHDLEQCRIANP